MHSVTSPREKEFVTLGKLKEWLLTMGCTRRNQTTVEPGTILFSHPEPDYSIVNHIGYVQAPLTP